MTHYPTIGAVSGKVAVTSQQKGSIFYFVPLQTELANLAQPLRIDFKNLTKKWFNFAIPMLLELCK